MARPGPGKLRPRFTFLHARDDAAYTGDFEIDWNHIYYRRKKLQPAQVGYRVRNIRHLGGRDEQSKVFNYGADLSLRPPGEPTKRLWLRV